MTAQNVFERRVISWLQHYLKSDAAELSELLVNEKIHGLKIAELNDLFDTIMTDDDEFDLSFFSLQPSVNEARIYYVEVLTKDKVMVKKLPVPIVGQRSFEETSNVVIKQFFETLVAALAEECDDGQLNEESSVVNEETRLTKETKYMKNSDDLVFKDLFGEEKVSEERSNDIELPKTWDIQDTDHSAYSFSLDILEEDDEPFEDYEYNEDDLELEIDKDEPKLIDFTSLNDEIVHLYRAADTETRQALKQVKADIWELELKQEDDEISANDIQALVQAILAIDVEEQDVLKWQVTTARNLL